MKKYYRISSRGFANEDTILSAGTPQEVEYCLKLCEKAENSGGWGSRITRKEAERITASNRTAYRRREADYCNPAGATEILTVASYKRAEYARSPDYEGDI